MTLTGTESPAVIDAVNQGIDSRLEACFVPDRGDSYNRVGRRLECEVSKESLPVLIRRLLEADGEEGLMLASAICETLEIELI
jgi:hypothetical protein